MSRAQKQRVLCLLLSACLLPVILAGFGVIGADVAATVLVGVMTAAATLAGACITRRNRE
ncbi:hypothetical protein ACU686_12930 [Yinghuangia aomiensis]